MITVVSQMKNEVARARQERLDQTKSLGLRCRTATVMTTAPSSPELRKASSRLDFAPAMGRPPALSLTQMETLVRKYDKASDIGAGDNLENLRDEAGKLAAANATARRGTSVAAQPLSPTWARDSLKLLRSNNVEVRVQKQKDISIERVLTKNPFLSHELRLASR